MQNSHDCMFCRYRKARIAACCAANGAAPAQAERDGPALAAPLPAPGTFDRNSREPSRQEAADFA